MPSADPIAHRGVRWRMHAYPRDVRTLPPWFACIALAACGTPAVNDAGPGDARDGAFDATTDTRRDVASTDGADGTGTPCGSATCTGGEACLDGGCVCPSTARCGATCCGGGQVCYLGGCVTPGMPCTQRSVCGTDAYCESSIGRCLPTAGRTACEYRPPSTFHPEVTVRWPRADTTMSDWSQIISTPLVVPIGAADPDGVRHPAIVFTAGQDIATAHLRAIDGNDGHDLFHNTTDPLPGQSQIAAADLDGDGTIEIIGTTVGTRSDCGFVGMLDGGRLVAFDGAGVVRWHSTEILAFGASAPAIADLDGDGHAEIVVGNEVFRSDGSMYWHGTMGAGRDACLQAGSMSIVADIDADGHPDVIAGNTAYRGTGALLWQAMTPGGAAVADGFPATADFDGDGNAEVVVVHGGTHGVSVLNGQTGVERCHGAAGGGGGGIGGGPPVVADFDGDHVPEFGVVFRNNYTVYEGDCRVLWSVPVTDDSGQTASSVFDFEGDGRAEVVYTDEASVKVFDGLTGAVRFTLPHRSATGLENPVVADVDLDGHAEIVAVGQGTPALEVFRDADRNWVASLGIWNQHSYHVTNVLETGAVPRTEMNNWRVSYLNNYRANVQGVGTFDVPNLTLTDLLLDLTQCPARVGLRVRVVNRGARGVPAGVLVRFTAQGGPFATPVTVDAHTTRTLLPGDSEVVSASVMVSTGGMGTFNVTATVDPAMAPAIGNVRECVEDDNNAGPAAGTCDGPM